MRVLLAVLLSLSSLTLAADDKAPVTAPPAMSAEEKAMMEAFQRMGEIRAEHKQLEYFVGNWKTKQTLWMVPGAPPEMADGKATMTKIWGGRYFEFRQEATMMGQPFSGVGTWGYDNLKGKYFSTWIDSMSTGMWLSLGSYDAKTKIYTFNGAMDDPMVPGKTIPIRMMNRIVDQDHYIFDWLETRDGKEVKTMQIEYSRL